jgi:DNA-binding PadR family transcriptional regulator
MTNDDATLSPLRLAILGLVAMQPQSGYDLKKVFDTTPMGSFSSSPGAIYPALKSLEQLGWIRGRRDNPGSLRPRTTYSITGEGDAVLRAELGKPVTHEALIWQFDRVMLRFAFIERLGPVEALRFLAEFQRESEAYVTHLERLRRELADQMSPCNRLALEHGIQAYRGHARWAARAASELAKLANEREGSR